MQNDHNATWDECETVQELEQSLLDTIAEYNEQNDLESFDFYYKIFSELQERQEVKQIWLRD